MRAPEPHDERHAAGTVVRPALFAPTVALCTSTILAVSLVFTGLLTRRTDMVAFGLPFAVHAARGWTRRPSGQWVFSPTPTSAPEDEAVTMRAEVDGSRVLVTLAWPGLQLSHRRPAFGAATGVSWAAVAIAFTRWGSHEIGQGIAHAVDAAGSWSCHATVSQRAVRVRPREEQMTGSEGVRHPLGVQGVHLTSLHGEGTELAEIREYRPGDRLRRITWPASSRSDELYVVDSFVERDTDVLVVLDALRPVRGASADDEGSLDIGARATLALASHYLAFGDRVGVHDLSGRLSPVRTASGPRQLVVLAEHLTRVSRGEAVTTAVLRPVPPVRRGTLVFCCTPLLDDDVLAELGRLRAAGADLVVVDTLPSKVGSRPAVVAAKEGDVELPLAWRLRRLQREAVAEALARQGIPVAGWSGPTSLASVLQAMERSRTAVRAVSR